MMSLSECEAILRILAGGGGDYVELFGESRHFVNLRLDDRLIDHAIGGSEGGVGLRILKGDLTLYASTNSFERDALEGLAQKLAATAGGPPLAIAPLKLRERERFNPVEVDPRSISLGRKVELLTRADAVARSVDPRILQVTGSYSESVREVVVANSLGDYCRDTRTLLVFSIQSMASAGSDLQTARKTISEARGWEMFSRDENDPARLARLSAELAIRNLEAEPAPAGTFSVVLSSTAGGTMVHEACGHGLEGDFVKRQMSVYAGRLGERVASPLITVIDDGTLPHRRGTERFDDEGAPTERVILIEQGVLRRYLQSRKTASETALEPTGHGRRESFRHVPIPRMRNTMIAPGESDPATIIASVPFGIFVADMGGGEVDVVSGNFVFQVTEGYLIEDGKVTRAIRGASLVGNGIDVLSTIDMVGNDLGFSVGTCGKEGQGVPVADAQPTLRIPRLIVSGPKASDARN